MNSAFAPFANFYASVFRNASVTVLSRNGAGEEPDKEGTVRYADVVLEGLRFGAMDSTRAHDFAFNEAVSFMLDCARRSKRSIGTGKACLRLRKPSNAAG